MPSPSDLPLPSPGPAAAARETSSWALVIVAAVLIAYCNSFAGPFIFDDPDSIANNPSIRHWATSLTPPHGGGITVEGRPVLNLSLACNYAVGKTAVVGYHVVNLAVHAAAALTLFGLARRTLGRLPDASPLRGPAPFLAASIALLWALHPLQTEAVTYVVQRAESLMGLFFLLTLYGFVRAADAAAEGRVGPGRAWMLASVAACTLGMGTKEVMVAAPLIVFLYDRTFVAGTFAVAWRRRRGYYGTLAATWIVLAALVVPAGNRGGFIGSASGVTSWEYLLCQSRAVIHYLRLALWPSPLIFDYGADRVVHLLEVLPYATADLLLLGATLVALKTHPRAGFLGAWFFLILAPTSSVVGGSRQMLAEHRMYLPLAAVVAALVLILFLAARGKFRPVVAGVALVLCVLTVLRNRDYRSAFAIYRDTVAKRPDNEWAHVNLGYALAQMPGGVPWAVREYRIAVRLNPAFALGHENLGVALSRTPSQMDEAVAELTTARALEPEDFQIRFDLGTTLAQVPGRAADAAAELRVAVRLNPQSTAAHVNLGNVLMEMPGQVRDAIVQYRLAETLSPDLALVHLNLANALSRLPDQAPAAIAEYQAALRIDPDSDRALDGIAALAPAGAPTHQN